MQTYVDESQDRILEDRAVEYVGEGILRREPRLGSL